MVTKEAVKQVMDDVSELDLPDGAHWALVHERLGLEYGSVFEIIIAHPQFFGVTQEIAGDAVQSSQGDDS